jgi:hypothetical protein
MSTNSASESDKAKILSALGGKRGLIDSGIPSLAFLLVFSFSKQNLNLALYVSIALSLIFTVIRLIRRETVQHAFSGLIGVLVCALFARKTGHASDFYLPGLLTNIFYAVLYAVLNLIKWPLLGLMLGPILGENMKWRQHPNRLAVYQKAGWIWVGLFVSRLAVQYPLYLTDNLTALGTARLIMGYPMFLLAAWLTWKVLVTVPSIKDES